MSDATIEFRSEQALGRWQVGRYIRPNRWRRFWYWALLGWRWVE